MTSFWRYIETYSLLLLAGTALALAWANLAPGSYHSVIDFPLWRGGPVGVPEATPGGADGHRVLTLHFLVNDMLMALFFFLAGKEVWEAVALPGGALRGRRALTPLFAAGGGMLGPILVYLAGAAALGQTAALARGWAVPAATDIAFSYLVGRLVFGARHPAVAFLLLLAIADDAAGLLILAVFYPSGALAPGWLLLSAAAALAAGLATRGPLRHAPVWPILLAGAASWYGFHKAGIHPALGLLPILPAIPHGATDLGAFAQAETLRGNLLDRIGAALRGPVQVVLFFFGLANAGVELTAAGAATGLVLAGLVFGKPLGILGFGWLAARPLGFGLPEGMAIRDLAVLGCVAAIGFTVSLFVAGVAFPPGPTQDAAKMGALLSFGAGGIALAAGRLLRIRRSP